LDDSGSFPHDDVINFGLVSIKDVLKNGNTSATVKEDFEFPKPVEGCYNIALYHGSPVKQSMFAGYDIALLGDVHSQEVWGSGQITEFKNVNIDEQDVSVLFNKKIDGLTYGYSGSMIRQGPGESKKGHGFLCWDITQTIVEGYHILNTSDPPPYSLEVFNKSGKHMGSKSEERRDKAKKIPTSGSACKRQQDRATPPDQLVTSSATCNNRSKKCENNLVHMKPHRQIHISPIRHWKCKQRVSEASWCVAQEPPRGGSIAMAPDGFNRKMMGVQ
jgi:hypothetical protein